MNRMVSESAFVVVNLGLAVYIGIGLGPLWATPALLAAAFGVRAVIRNLREARR
jgi:hypothetical protein